MTAAASTAADEHLIKAAREGSDEALEALYRRYQGRITAYVRGIVGDHGRTEDLVQETFISAFNGLRATDREIVFKPWIYQIARNACIDQLRRLKRAEEVSIDSEDFKPSEEGRLAQAAPSTDAAVSQREEMEVLKQAFGGLPPSQHEALVMRELEGLSYAEIGGRMRISPAAVESMLFRARRGLKDEYEDIATGERCRRMQGLMASLAEGLGGSRDRRALARHVQDCSLCRHEAVAMGLGSLVLPDRPGKVRSALHRAAALLPLPWLFRRRRSSPTSDGGASGLATRAQTALSNAGLAVGAAGEQAASFVPKAVAVLAAAVVIGAGGVVGEKSGSSSVSPRAPAAAPANGARGSTAPGVGSPLFPARPLHGGVWTGSPSAPGDSSLGASPSAVGGEQTAAGLALPGALDTLGGAPAARRSPDSLSLPGTARPAEPLRDAVGEPSVPALGGNTLPNLDSGTSGGGGDLPSVRTPKVPDLPTLKQAPVLEEPRAPAPPSGPSGPSVPAMPPAPRLPAAPSVDSGASLDSVTNTVQGVTGATSPVTSGLLR